MSSRSNRGALLSIPAAALLACAGAEVPPPPGGAGRGLLDAAERLRASFERGDRLAFMAEVDAGFRPSRDRLEQSLIDVSLRVRDARLEFSAGERSRGPGETGLGLRWYRSWVVQETNRMERKEGRATFVFRGEEAPRLIRIEGDDPFGP